MYTGRLLFIQVYTFCCRKCLQTLPWWPIKVDANTADAKSHTTKHNMHRLTANGGLVTPWWPWLRPLCWPPAPLDSAPTPETSLLKFTRLRRLESKTQAECHWLPQIYFPGGQSCIFMRVCLRIQLLASSSECMACWDKDAGGPHPSTNSDKQVQCTCHSLKMFCGDFSACWTPVCFRWMWVSDYSHREMTSFRLVGWAKMSPHINHPVWTKRKTITCSAAPRLTLAISTHTVVQCACNCPEAETAQGS